MAQKIFISYRRQDTAANALSIGQYLENEFGRKNVFIDVDMRAGVKFPAVLEQRLAECKVMLVLIGPTWLEARDDQGNRRLDSVLPEVPTVGDFVPGYAASSWNGIVAPNTNPHIE